MRRLPPLNALRAFESAARLGSIGRAGEELCVTHGAVSRQVKQLENWLGVELFVRSGRSVSLTPAGLSYRQMAATALDLIAEGTAGIQNRRPSNTISVATTHSFASKWLVPRLPGFSALHPGIEVWLNLGQGLSDFTQQGVDVAIRMGVGPWPEHHCVPLLRDRLIVVCSPKLLEDGPKLHKPRDLSRHVLLHDQDPDTQWQRWLKEYPANKFAANSGPRYSSHDVLLQAAIAGQGVALVREVLARDDLANGRLVQALDEAVDLGVNHWLLMPESYRHQPSISNFAKWLALTAEAD